ncbi:MAG TPA: polysaccharide deacetylase family protein [Gammaproteobacteria bacterium]|nr:polysaccharide deacetylase family protein [Gammaproteobacteria bacterium]
MRWLGTLMLASLLTGQALGGEHGVILAYHHVATDTPPSTSISPDDFRGHLEYLRDNNFNVIALDQMIESLQQGQEIPDKSIAITFDDGYISIYETAFPMLQSFGYPFTLFVSTQAIDDNQANYMTWAQIQEMSDAGMVIANHMVDHPYMLERADAESDQQWIDRLRAELLHAEERILSNTGQSHKYLAYPYGEFDPTIKGMLAELDFVGLAQNSGAVGFNSDFLALPRFPLASIYADLDSARIKLDTLAFHVSELTPESPVTDRRSPSVTLRFEPGNYNREQIGCFANSRPIPMNWTDPERGIVTLEPTESYNGRRWRYICTAPAIGQRRFYWYSVQWIVP